MQRPRVQDALVLLAAPVAAVGLVALDDAGSRLDLLWAVILVECLAVVCLLARASVRCESAARRAAERLSATGEQEAAQRAVVEERVLLAADIEAMVRLSTLRMAALADEADRRWDGDPDPALAAVQAEGRRATDELRRMLGLLRDAEASPAPVPAEPPARRRSWWMLDLVLRAGIAALALAEGLASAGSPEVPAGSNSPIAWALTALAASTLALHRVAPGAGAAACGVLYLLGALIGRPLPGGLWVLATLGVLGWAAAARSRRADWLGLAVLTGCLVVAQAWRDPENLGIDLVILGVAVVAGAFVGRRSARTAAARQQARQRAAELARAAEAAVRAERLAVARDLHDVVSHGVGVMAMQAGAAGALRAGDPAQARAALDVVRRTAAASVAELDRLMDVIRQGAMGLPLRADAARGTDGLPDLVQRMRAAGLAVEFGQTGRLDDAPARVVYRVVQEALTNALRHAPGAAVRVQVTAGEHDVEISVADDGPGPAHTTRRGFGLVGIAERVGSLGGELLTGPAPGGGFRVHARIPLAAGVPA